MFSDKTSIIDDYLDIELGSGQRIRVKEKDEMHGVVRYSFKTDDGYIFVPHMLYKHRRWGAPLAICLLLCWTLLSRGLGNPNLFWSFIKSGGWLILCIIVVTIWRSIHQTLPAVIEVTGRKPMADTYAGFPLVAVHFCMIEKIIVRENSLRDSDTGQLYQAYLLLNDSPDAILFFQKGTFGKEKVYQLAEEVSLAIGCDLCREA